MPESHDELPKFVQMANRIRDQILSGNLGAGDEVPSERALAVEWGVARPTAARALQELRRLGLVESRQGSGSFVRGHLDVHRRARDRYARSQAAGRVYSEGEWATIVSAKMVRAPARIAAAMGIAVGEMIGRRHRITGDANGPNEISTSWFPPEIVVEAPRLLDRQRIREGSLAYIETSVGRRGVVARDELSARLALAGERRELALDDPAAVLVVLHVVVDRKDRPLEVADAVYPSSGRWIFDQEYALVH